MKTRLNSMSLRSVGGVIPRSAKRRIYRFAVARVLANLLDILGLAGIALLATSFGAFAAGSGSAAPLNLPVIGEVVVNETAAVVIALLIAATFLLKSAFSIFFNLKTALFVASLDADFLTLRRMPTSREEVMAKLNLHVQKLHLLRVAIFLAF